MQIQNEGMSASHLCQTSPNSVSKLRFEQRRKNKMGGVRERDGGVEDRLSGGRDTSHIHWMGLG